MPSVAIMRPGSAQPDTVLLRKPELSRLTHVGGYLEVRRPLLPRWQSGRDEEIRANQTAENDEAGCPDAPGETSFPMEELIEH